MFGPHLILDGTRCDTQKLGDRVLIEQILSDYPDAIGMTRIGGPYMFEYQAPDPAYSGVSGIVVIAESHIAIHTFPALDYFTMDIFSCKNFDHERAIQYIKDALDVREMDRMLVQRGLSFRGPHHGANGATDELIAAAHARLEAGIISNETVSPDDLPAFRAQALAQRGLAASNASASAEAAPAGAMLWPQYGVTPDLGTYGPAATAPAAPDPASDDACEPCARGGARVVPLHSTDHAPRDGAGAPLPALEPVQVNPTASLSGLLDKLSALGASGALGRALATWERLARDPRTALWLTLGVPVIAEGLREVLVYAVERRYVDGIVLTGEDVFADVHEALGHHHYRDGQAPVLADGERAHTLSFIARLIPELAAANPGVHSGSGFLTALGFALPTRAPRKGLLQAAAASGVPLFAPDLLAGSMGAALLAARELGATPHLDPLEDLRGLSQTISEQPDAALICAGGGLARTLWLEARALGPTSPTLAGTITLDLLPAAAPGADVAVQMDPALALPLLLTGLAQRLPRRAVRSTRDSRSAADQTRLRA